MPLPPDRAGRARRALWYVSAGVVCFWTSMTVCSLLVPTNWSLDGISHWGNVRASRVPYAVGLLSMAVLMRLAARAMPNDELHLVIYRWLVTVSAALIVVVLVTPPIWGHAVGRVHLIAGSILFVCQMLLAIELALIAWPRRLIAAITALQIAGVLLSLISLWHVVEALFAGQVIAQMAFGLVLVSGTAHLSRELQRSQLAVDAPLGL